MGDFVYTITIQDRELLEILYKRFSFYAGLRAEVYGMFFIKRWLHKRLFLGLYNKMLEDLECAIYQIHSRESKALIEEMTEKLKGYLSEKDN